MSRSFFLLPLLLSTINFPLSTLAQGTAFTYQGRLIDGAAPANGIYDLRFTLCDSTNLPGIVISGPLTSSATGVTNGLFTVALDFGAGVFFGPDRWLEIGARTNGGGAFVTLSPRQPVTPSPYAIFASNAGNLQNNGVVGLRVSTQPNTASYSNVVNVVGGSPINVASGIAATVAGGGASVSGFDFPNSVVADFGTIGGGAANKVFSGYGTIGGGWGNTANALQGATISGGYFNTASGDFSAVSAGAYNTASGAASFVGGGENNTASGFKAIIGGGDGNNAGADFATISGGDANSATASFATASGGDGNTAGASNATVGGGQGNSIQVGANASTISGGILNGVRSNAAWSTIAGGVANTIQTNAFGSFIGGGSTNLIQLGTSNSVIAGGGQNVIGPGIGYATISGGHQNSGRGFNSTVAGGTGNIAADYATTVGGGELNAATVTSSTVSGGSHNIATNTFATVGGGVGNIAGQFGATIAGGDSNIASGPRAVVAGGRGNLADANAAAIVGGSENHAGGDHAFVGGGQANIAGGAYSFAAGQQAQALHQGAFVWADSQNAAFLSTANDQFNVRAQGGVGIGTGSPRAQFNVNGTARIDAASGAYSEGLTVNLPTDMPGGGYGGIHFHNASRGGAYGSGTIKWGIFYNYAPEGGTPGNGLSFVQGNLNTRLYISTNGNVGIGTNTPQQKLHVNGNILATGTITGGSDRNIKEHFAPIDPREVLKKVAALPISRWNYKEDAETPHVGPMAQDFYAAFKVGMDDKHISMVDADGVALAAIQGLNQKLEDKDSEIQQLKHQNDSLEQRLNQMETVLRKFTVKK